MKSVVAILILTNLLQLNFVLGQNKSYAIPLITLGLDHVDLPPLGIGHFLHEDYFVGSSFAVTEGLTYYFGNRALNLKKDTLNYPAISNENVLYKRGARGFSPGDYSQIAFQRYSKLFVHCLRPVDAFLSYQKYRKNEVHTISMSNQSLWQLSLSPFKWKYLREPEAFIPLLLSTGAALLNDEKHPSIFQTKTLNWLGYDVSPTTATIGNTFAEYLVLTLVSVGEEMLFRGMIQTELSESVNPDFGLIASSVLFGLYHVPNNGWLYSLRATAAGFYMGWQYKKSNYDLGRVIAIHFYIDFPMSFVDFLKDPLSGRGTYSIGL